MSRVPHASLSDARPKAYPALRSMCLNYEFWPSQHLQVDELAKLLHLSPTPVREALARLAGEGLVRAVPNRGYFAKSPSLAETDEMVELKFVLLWNVIPNVQLPDDWLKKQPQESLKFSDVNSYFEIILRAAGSMSNNILISESIGDLIDRTSYIRQFILQNVEVKSYFAKILREFTLSLEASCKESALSVLRILCESQRRRLPLAVFKAQSQIISTEPQLPLPMRDRQRRA